MSGVPVDLDGVVVASERVASAHARDLAHRLSIGQIPFAELIECRVEGQTSVVELEVDVEVPQHPVHDIHQRERLAVFFDAADARMPEVVPVRSDFPRVPHLNLAEIVGRTSICLFEEPYRDLRSRWTSAFFIERIRDWLRLTARGELHASDQPLEPLLGGMAGRLIVPHAVLTRAKPGDLPMALSVTMRQDSHGRPVLVATRASMQSIAEQGPPISATVFWAMERTHGLMTHRPASLQALHDYLQVGGDNLLEALRESLRSWCDAPRALGAYVLLIIVTPKTRYDDGPVESYDVCAFITDKKLRQVGIEIGVFQEHQGSLGLLLPFDADAQGQAVLLDLLNVSTTVPRDEAARYSGRVRSDNRAFVGIGAGALGSQVALIAARTAYGRWTLVDDDLVLPHNLLRHALSGQFIGASKAAAVAAIANSVVDSESPPFAYIDSDLLSPGAHENALATCLQTAEVIVDMSASVTVARYLSRDVLGEARRCSLFLNPQGADLVMLCESEDRAIRLDSLEMQYYRLLLQDPGLSMHLAPPSERVRNGRSCRDVSVLMSQELVAQHAAIGMRAIRTGTERSDASIHLWRTNLETGAVTFQESPVEHTVVYRVGGWEVVLDEGFLRRIVGLRGAKLPDETGGVLIGAFDLERRVIYVVDTIPSPLDSDERPTWYVRGRDDLPDGILAATKRAGGQVEYIGEWHSHPEGHSCHPSVDDAKLFGWLTHRMDMLGLPATMMIVGDHGDRAVFVGTMAVGELRNEHRMAVVCGIVGSAEGAH